MMTIQSIIKKNIELRAEQGIKITLLAACPNSEAVLAAGVKAAAFSNSVMLFAATLNQVDFDGGYTGWTPGQFVEKINHYAQKYSCQPGLFPCLDHGGPWLKDKDSINHLTFEETFTNVKQSIEACIRAGYSLLHIDPTVDRSLPPGAGISIETVVDRSVELISFAEHIRQRLNLPVISYEVGTEEVHGGMVDLTNFKKFVSQLRTKMIKENLIDVWPSFFVAQVGTDLHTTKFDALAASKIFEILVSLGSLAKGHYSDWVKNPTGYPKTGMGGANVGPEFTAEEFKALAGLEAREKILIGENSDLRASRFIEALTDAVVRSNRWKKWLLQEEKERDFGELNPDRKLWLVQTGSRYVWTDPEVLESRQVLYQNVAQIVPDPNEHVIDCIKQSMDKYLTAFNLKNSQIYYS
ncbi:MAG: class II D-tagatose-bisphosphate aldolase, non-catalytic subunit [Anaerolineaceae bacterium]